MNKKPIYTVLLLACLEIAIPNTLLALLAIMALAMLMAVPVILLMALWVYCSCRKVQYPIEETDQDSHCNIICLVPSFTGQYNNIY